MRIIVILHCGVVQNVFTDDLSANVEVIDCDALNPLERTANQKRMEEVKRVAESNHTTLTESYNNIKALWKKLRTGNERIKSTS